MRIVELVYKILSEEKRPLTTKEIWEIAKSKGYANQISTTKDDPSGIISTIIYGNIRRKSQYPFYKVSTNPTRFALKGKINNDISKSSKKEKPEKTELKPHTFKFLEEDMNEPFKYYIKNHLNIYPNRIDHKKSLKKKFKGETVWNFPDFVGVYFPTEKWIKDTIEFSEAIGYESIKIYSFEMKRELSFSNLKESFFQAVSNSSWAHEGYLVIAKLNEGDELRNELSRLSNSFGIGVIELDMKNIESSSIILPAKTKDQLDWNTADLLAADNEDFRTFLNTIIEVKKIKNKIKEGDFDKVMDKKELEEYLKYKIS